MSGVWCGALLYADDIVLIAESGGEYIAKDAGYMVGRYVECGSSGSMQGRVKVMVVGLKNSSEKWKIGDEEMEEVARVLQIPGCIV